MCPPLVYYLNHDKLNLKKKRLCAKAVNVYFQNDIMKRKGVVHGTAKILLVAPPTPQDTTWTSLGDVQNVGDNQGTPIAMGIKHKV